MMISRARQRHARVRYFVIVGILLAQSLAMYGQSSVTADVTIENFGKINESYYRGSQPLADQFTQLKALGIKTVIDLRQDSVKQASEWARATSLQYVNIPLTTRRAATPEQTEYFLKLVNDQANWPVYVHCKGGRHRTGEMTAIYRITRDGWSADQAYEEMKKYDFEDSFFYPRSLRKYVYSYYKQFTSQKPAPELTVQPQAKGLLNQ
jgi:protein tyrosine/serine phosphatase